MKRTRFFLIVWVFLLIGFAVSSVLAQTIKVAAWGANGYSEAWVPTNLSSIKTAQGDQQNENSGALEAIVANIGKLGGLRHQVQLAAEQAWPWRNPGVASIRKSFLLPTDRPMRG